MHGLKLRIEGVIVEIGQNIKRNRERLKLSQETLAKLIGVTQQAVERWENAGIIPREKKLKELMKVFQISRAELFGELQNNTDKVIRVPVSGEIRANRMSVIAERLRKLREQCQLSQGEVAEKIGISRTAYVKYETGDTSPVRRLNELSKLFGVSTDYIMGLSPFSVSNDIDGNHGMKRIPIIGSVKYGSSRFIYDYTGKYLSIDNAVHGDIRACHCKGDSMIGLGIFDGDVALIRIQPDVETGEIALVTINENEGVLKRVYKKNNIIILESANPDYPLRIFAGADMKQIHVVGRVIEVRKQF